MSFQIKPQSKYTKDENIKDTKSALKHIDNKSGLATSPLNTLLKVLKVPMVKKTTDESSKHMGGEDDSDDDVFIDENKAKKPTEKSSNHEDEKVVTQATVSCDVTPSVTASTQATVSCDVTSSVTTMPTKSETQNIHSRELTAAGETAVR